MRFLFLFSSRLALALALASSSLLARAEPPADGALTSWEHTRLANPDPTEANTATITALLLQNFNFSRQPFDAKMSSRFLDRYLDSLDYGHLYFLQSDLKEFEIYRTNLQVLTLKKNDVSPAYVIFTRFLERARQRASYATNLLQTEKFEFTDHERFIPNRHTLPNPKDMAQAREFWRQELRTDYLDEKIRALDMAFSGPITFDAGSNLVISLPLHFTNTPVTLSRNTNAPAKPILLQSLLPDKLLDKNHREIGRLSADTSNLLVRLPISPAENLRKITNNFFSDDGRRLGSISFLRVTDPADETNQTAGHAPTSLPAKYRGVVQLNQKDRSEIVNTLTKRNLGLLKNYNDLTNEDYVLEAYLTSLAHAYDPHSDFFEKEQSENFAIQMKLSLFGIGARLQSGLDGNCTISELVPEGPAAKSGQITNDDQILSVAQEHQEPVEVTGMPLTKVVEMVRGPKGTPVTLNLLLAHPADPSVRTRVVTLIRDEIKLEDQAAKALIFETPAGSSGSPTRIGVIDVPSFYADMDTHTGTTSDLAKLIARLKEEKTDGIILDLRRNGGGYLEEAIGMTGLFIGKGPVVQTKSPDGTTDTDSSPFRAIYDGPLIVLTSRFSASASEILAGALQDYDRALIVGDKSTFGKGTVQTVLSLTNYMPQEHLTWSYDPGTLKVTIKKFYRAGGASTQSNGVASDIVLPSILNYADVGENSLPNPLPWDDVTSADIRDLNRVKPYLAELSRRSVARRKTEKDFAYLQEDIDEYRKTLADKSVSLNEADRLGEQHTREARQEARKIERAARPKSTEKVYDLTLKNLGDAELHLVAKAKPAAPTAGDDDADPAEPDAISADPTANDFILTETRRIMADYISLMHKPLAAKQD